MDKHEYIRFSVGRDHVKLCVCVEIGSKKEKRFLSKHNYNNILYHDIRITKESNKLDFRIHLLIN